MNYSHYLILVSLLLIAGCDSKVDTVENKTTEKIEAPLFKGLGDHSHIITTQSPDDSQLEVAISALKNAFGDKLSEYEGKEFNADAIG